MYLVLERLAIVVFFVIFVTQVIAPCFFQRLRFFWIFRRSEKSIREKEKLLADIESLKKEADLNLAVHDELTVLEKKERVVDKKIEKIKKP